MKRLAHTHSDSIRLLALTVLIVAGALAGAGLLLYRDWRNYLDSPEPALAEPHLVELKRGMSFTAIMQELQKEKVVSRPRLIELEARRLKVTTNMKAGEYIFHPGQTPLQVLDMITRGEITRVTLTVPEGFTIYDIAKRLSTLGPWTEDGFIKAATDPLLCAEAGSPIASLEGHLFPAVYSLRMSMDEPTVVKLMLQRGLTEQDDKRLKRAEELGLTWHQVLTLASMLQKEAMQEGEMPIIAGVFYRRLKLNMPLQSDPTAIYGIKDMKDGITGADIRRPGPYNTYTNRGLPPGPICAPGAAAIKAALYPVDSEYLFFVADGKGRHYFSKTYAEHERNIAIYRRQQSERGSGAGNGVDDPELEELLRTWDPAAHQLPNGAPEAAPENVSPAPEEPAAEQPPAPPTAPAQSGPAPAEPAPEAAPAEPQQ